MDLDLNDKIILAIYREFYGKKYDCEDDKKCEEGHHRVNHIEVQNALFVFNMFGYCTEIDYGFVWNQHGPHSIPLENDLKALDLKNKSIEVYYDYDDDGKHGEKLNLILNELAVYNLEMLSYDIKEITKIEHGGELLGSLAFISSLERPYDNSLGVIRELKRRTNGLKGAFSNDEIIRKAWIKLNLYGLVPELVEEDAKKLDKVPHWLFFKYRKYNFPWDN